MRAKVLVVEAAATAGARAGGPRWLLCERFETGAVALREWRGARAELAGQARAARARLWAIEAGERRGRWRARWERIASELGAALAAAPEGEAEALAALEGVLEREGRTAGAGPHAMWQRFGPQGERAARSGERGATKAIIVQCALGAQGKIWLSRAGRWLGAEPRAGEHIEAAWVFSHTAVEADAARALDERLEALRAALSQDTEEETAQAARARVERTLEAWEGALEGADAAGWAPMRVEPPRRGPKRTGFARRMGQALALALLAGVLWWWLGERGAGGGDARWRVEGASGAPQWGCPRARGETLARAREAMLARPTAGAVPERAAERIREGRTTLSMHLDAYGLHATIDPASGWMRVEGPAEGAWYEVDMRGVRECTRDE